MKRKLIERELSGSDDSKILRKDNSIDRRNQVENVIFSDVDFSDVDEEALIRAADEMENSFFTNKKRTDVNRLTCDVCRKGFEKNAKLDQTQVNSQFNFYMSSML